MAVALHSRPVLTKPSLGIGLDFSHPLAKGLVLCVVFNQGAGLTVQDLTGNPNHQFLGSSSGIGWLPSPDIGPATDISGTGVWATASGPSDSPFLGDITIVWRGAVDTGSALRDFVSKHLTNGGTANPFGFFTHNATDVRPRFVRANTGHRAWITLAAGDAGVLNKVQTFAVSHVPPIENPPVFYINGYAATGTGAIDGTGTGAPTGASAAIRIGSRDDAAVQMDGKCDYVLIWNRILTPTEHLWLATEPYTFMLPPASWRRWLLPQTSVLDLSAYRWRDDDNNEALASYLAAENTAVSRAKEQNVRLRVQIDADGDPSSQQYKLQYRRSGNTEWIDVEP